MTADQLVPGISKYPELAQQLELRLDRRGSQKCSSCAQSALIREFSRKLKAIQERERMSKG